MDISYCDKKCSIGTKVSKEFLKNNNSAYSAAIDFRLFIKECVKTCPYKEKYVKEEAK